MYVNFQIAVKQVNQKHQKLRCRVTDCLEQKNEFLQLDERLVEHRLRFAQQLHLPDTVEHTRWVGSLLTPQVKVAHILDALSLAQLSYVCPREAESVFLLGVDIAREEAAIYAFSDRALHLDV